MIFDSFRRENLEYEDIVSPSLINIDEINDGVSQNENFIFHRRDESITIYDRVCDHNGGRLSLDKAIAKCPLHGWELNPEDGRYLNAGCSKTPLLKLSAKELDAPFVDINLKRSVLRPHNYTQKSCVSVRFLNHACLLFRVDGSEGISFATDPWVIGSAFCNGWWLARESPDDVFDALNSCDFIYISHNHPDHLHPDSLKHIRKDMPLLTAGFKSGSTRRLLEECGFQTIFAMDFVSRISSDRHSLSLAVLKSGDFRDDSGLFVEAGEFKCLLTVDSNFLNFGRLPEVDLLCSSFAGGASGFALCFENYSEEEKVAILSRNRGAIKATNLKNLQHTKPKYFMPYAGFFSESAERDGYIKARNAKNTIGDYQRICDSASVKLLDVTRCQVYEFEGSSLTQSRVDNANRYVDEALTHYISNVPSLSTVQVREVVLSYFRAATLFMPLELDLILTDDAFQSVFERFYIDFSTNKVEFIDAAVDSSALQLEARRGGNQYLRMKVRRGEFLGVILNGKPWEDLSIGFQCRIFREPNVYESEFWSYFTNIYIGRFAQQASRLPGAVA